MSGIIRLIETGARLLVKPINKELYEFK